MSRADWYSARALSNSPNFAYSAATFEWALAFPGTARTSAEKRVKLFRQSRFRTTVRAARATRMADKTAHATVRLRSSSRIQSKATSRQKPADGRYASRSPMIVPVGTRIFAVTENATRYREPANSHGLRRVKTVHTHRAITKTAAAAAGRMYRQALYRGIAL